MLGVVAFALCAAFVVHRSEGFTARSSRLHYSRVSYAIKHEGRVISHFRPFYANGLAMKSAMITNSYPDEITTTTNHNMISAIKTKVLRSLVLIAPIAFYIALFTLFGVTINPSHALAKTGRKSAAAAAAAAGSPSLLRKILEGANVQGSFRTWKAGDTRTEFAALLNTISGLLILGFLGFLGYLKHTQREMTMNYKMKKELVKIVEYKEKMYFEAVEELLKKMSDPKYKAGAKETMKRQLKDLDPEGVIQKYISGGGDKPDISNLINRPKGKHKDDKGTLKDKPKKGTTKKPSGSKGSKLSSKDLYGDDDVDEEAEESEPPRPVDRRMEPVQPPAAKAPPAAEEKREEGAAAAASPKKKKDTYLTVLSELYESLDGVLRDDKRNALLALLQERIEAIADPAKREATVAKIAERLGDEDYWVTYAKRID